MKSLKIGFIALFAALSCKPVYQPENYQLAGLNVSLPDTSRMEYIMPFPDWIPNRLGLYNAKKWPREKREFRIQFVNGDQDIYNRTLEDWEKGITTKTGLRFVQYTPPSGLIQKAWAFLVSDKPDMITSFTQNNQAWSYVGKDLAQIAAQNQSTMNLGWHIRYRNNEGGERYGTGNHEMLHALGYIHTLQSPASVGNLVWNKDFVYAKYAKLGWNKTMVYINVLSTYSASIVTDNAWDPKSIMCYPVGPGEANIQVGRNNEFSSIDNMKLISDYAGAEPPVTGGNTEGDSLLSCFRPARQSSNYNAQNSYPAEKAFDCRNQPLHGANFSQTGLELNPFIEVDLGQTYNIGQIDVINRMDNSIAKARLKRFRIFATNTPLTELPLTGEIASYNQASPALDSIKYTVNANARYVRLWMENAAPNYLSLSELRVWGSQTSVICRDTIYKVPYISFRDSLVRICDTVGI